MLQSFGSAPTYDTPTGVKGDYLDVDGNPVTRPHTNAKTMEEAPISTVAIPPHLENRETFLEYLNTKLDIKREAYSAGNTLTAQMREIMYRDEVLKSEGADYSLVDTLIDWLNENQNKENGLWNEKADYFGVNGLMKISGSDYHHDHHIIGAGIETEVPVTSEKQLVEILREGNYTLIRSGAVHY